MYKYFKDVMLFIIICSACVINSCKNNNVEQKTKVDLFGGFQNPPAEARPFVRWWWNGNKIKAQELDRELELLNKAGFGGVEINPIAMPKVTNTNAEEAIFVMDNQRDKDNESLDANAGQCMIVLIATKTTFMYS